MPFWADVFVTYRPVSTLRTFEGLNGYEDSGKRRGKLEKRSPEKRQSTQT